MTSFGKKWNTKPASVRWESSKLDYKSGLIAAFFFRSPQNRQLVLLRIKNVQKSIQDSSNFGCKIKTKVGLGSLGKLL